MIPQIVVNITIYNYWVNSLKVSIDNRLEAIRDLRVNELGHWLDERITDIRTIAADDGIQALELIQGGAEDYRYNNVTAPEARARLRKYLQDHNSFYDIFVVSPRSRKILLSTNESDEGKVISKEIRFEAVLKEPDILNRDVLFSAQKNIPRVAFSMPVFRQTGSSHPIGFIVARVDTETSLLKMLNQTGVEETGETYILNKDGIVMNNLRWHGNSAFSLKLRSQPDTEAVLGNTGIVEAFDYRGEKVLAAYTYIPQTGWGFVAKQDIREVYGPVYQLRNRTIIIGIISFFIVILLAFGVSRSISNPIRALHKGSEIIGRGNLGHRVGTDTKDEIGQLSRNFDLMIENLKTITASRDDLNREIAERRYLEKMLLEIKEHERRRIGHDLHDNLGQQLTAISFMAQGLENKLKKTAVPEAEDAARLTYLVEMSKGQVRSLSTGLSPILEAGEYSLITAMVELALNSEKLFRIPCTVRSNKIVPIYNEAALIHLYRIAQEAITNAARHAMPRQIEIYLDRSDNDLIMTIKDDGKGFALQPPQKGMGLQIMKYRADIINAWLDITTDIDKGTVITCIFPDTDPVSTTGRPVIFSEDIPFKGAYDHEKPENRKQNTKA